MRFLSRVLIVALAGVLLVSCGWSGSRMASEKQQQVIEDEFWTLLAETVENAQADASRFVYSGGALYKPEKVEQRSVRVKSYCHNDDGTRLYRLDVYISDRGQYNSEERYRRMILAMRQKWETQGREVEQVGPVTAGEEIVFSTEAGTRVFYSAGRGAEIIHIETACVLPADPDPSASSS